MGEKHGKSTAFQQYPAKDSMPNIHTVYLRSNVVGKNQLKLQAEIEMATFNNARGYRPGTADEALSLSAPRASATTSLNFWNVGRDGYLDSNPWDFELGRDSQELVKVEGFQFLSSRGLSESCPWTRPSLLHTNQATSKLGLGQASTRCELGFMNVHAWGDYIFLLGVGLLDPQANRSLATRKSSNWS